MSGGRGHELVSFVPRTWHVGSTWYGSEEVDPTDAEAKVGRDEGTCWRSPSSLEAELGPEITSIEDMSWAHAAEWLSWLRSQRAPGTREAERRVLEGH